MVFCTKPPNFGVEAHMEAPAGDALTSSDTEKIRRSYAPAMLLLIILLAFCVYRTSEAALFVV
jgi:hypothetical protein